METSVSGFTVTGASPRRSTRTIAEVVCGTSASRTVWSRKVLALPSTKTETRTGTSESFLADPAALKAPAILSMGTFMFSPPYEKRSAPGYPTDRRA